MKTEFLHLWEHTVGSRLALVCAAILSVLTSGVSLLQPLFADRLISQAQIGSGFNLKIVLLMAVAVVIIGFLTTVKDYIAEASSESIVLRIRTRGFDNILDAPLPTMSSWQSGDMTSRVVTDVESINEGLARGLVDIGGAIVMSIGASVALCLIDIPSFLIVLFAVLFVAFCGLVGASEIKKVTEKRHDSLGRLSTIAEDYFSRLLLIRTNNLTESVRTDARKASMEIRQNGLKLAKVHAILAPISSLSVEIAFIAVLIFGALRVAHGNLSIGALTAFVMYISLLITPIGTLTNSISMLSETFGSMKRLNELDSNVDKKSVQKSDENLLRSVNHDSVKKNSSQNSILLSLKNVSYTYPNSDKPAVDKVSFCVPRNKISAVVGPSGAGKTTLIWILDKLIAPSSGEIMYAGTSLNTIPTEDYRDRVSVALQGSSHWGNTLWDSLTLGEEKDPNTVVELFRKLGLLDFLERLPNGFKSSNGSVLDFASAGELQRISIVRAVLRDPSFLILDEPTSNLDADNEKRVCDLIASMKGHITVLLVAHRKRSVELADNVIVMREGHVETAPTNTETLNHLMDSFSE